MLMKQLPKLIAIYLSLVVGLMSLCGFFWRDPTWEAINRRIDSKYPTVKNINTESLKSKLEQGERVILIDVREKEEYEVSHIPHAYHITEPEQVPFVKESAIVVYCSVGARSASFAQKLGGLGYGNVKNLRGSIFEWANKGYPLERDGKPTDKVHPYNKVWGLLLQPELRSE